MNKTYLCDGIKYWVPFEYADENIYLIKVDVFDKFWEKDFAYIPKNKGHMAKREIIEGVLGKGDPLEVPEVSDNDLHIGFIDGRHRFAVIRDLGKKVTVFRCKKNLDYSWAKKIAP